MVCICFSAAGGLDKDEGPLYDDIPPALRGVIRDECRWLPPATAAKTRSSSHQNRDLTRLGAFALVRLFSRSLDVVIMIVVMAAILFLVRIMVTVTMVISFVVMFALVAVSV